MQRGSITKQGPPLVRWAAIEAVSKNHGGDPIKQHYRRVAERRGKNKGRVAAARKVLTLVYYGLRVGEIPVLDPTQAVTHVEHPHHNTGIEPSPDLGRTAPRRPHHT